MKDRIRVLIANDDGLHAPGLIALASSLVEADRYDIRISAPAANKSGVSHSVTYATPLYAQEVDFIIGGRKIPAVKVHGYPADCTIFAIGHVWKDFNPDIIVSGINEGTNASVYANYSGTIAAAREGRLLGYSAIAFSLHNHRCTLEEFKNAADACIPVIDSVVKNNVGAPVLLSVNLPNIPVRGYILTEQGEVSVERYHVPYDPAVEKGVVPEAVALSLSKPLEDEKVSEFYKCTIVPTSTPKSYRLAFNVTAKPDDTFSDFLAATQGYVTVTPFIVNYTCGNTSACLKSWPLFTENPTLLKN